MIIQRHDGFWYKVQEDGTETLLDERTLEEVEACLGSDKTEDGPIEFFSAPLVTPYYEILQDDRKESAA